VGWRRGTIELKCNYKLLIDNLMDLTYETCVHASSIGDEKLPGTPIETTSDATSVIVKRFIVDHQPAQFWKNAIRNALKRQDNCDRWQIIKYTVPSTIAIDVGVAVTGSGALEGDRELGVNGYVLNAITPETESSTLYFWNPAVTGQADRFQQCLIC
jgi:phenylpropionate dioxygenase-like ring-hydroxylating dioxygenase large terminal subunit